MTHSDALDKGIKRIAAFKTVTDKTATEKAVAEIVKHVIDDKDENETSAKATAGVTIAATI